MHMTHEQGRLLLHLGCSQPLQLEQACMEKVCDGDKQDECTKDITALDILVLSIIAEQYPGTGAGCQGCANTTAGPNNHPAD